MDKSWLLALLLPFAWSWAKRKLPGMVAVAIRNKLKSLMDAKGFTDEDVKELLKTVVGALVRFAEKKLPDEGLGQARMRLILDTLQKLPYGLGTFAKAHETDIKELIESEVLAMDVELKKLKA